MAKDLTTENTESTEEMKNDIISLKIQRDTFMALADICKQELQKGMEELLGLRATFDVRWKAQLSAVDLWERETGQKLMWPRQEDLCLWLLKKLEAAK